MAGKLFNHIAITGLSLVCPLGDDFRQVGAAVRADVKAFSEHPRYQWQGCPKSKQAEALVQACPVPVIDPLIDGQERTSKLALQAFTRLQESGQFRPDWSKTAGLVLALPQNDEVISSWPYDTKYLQKLSERAQLPPFKSLMFNQFGATGMFFPMHQIAESLQTGQLEFCILGGLESHLMLERMALADKHWRLKTPRNVDGFTPGEAAVMLVLETVEHARNRGGQILAIIEAAGFGNEPNDFLSAKASTATGLTDALRGIMEAKGVSEQEHVFQHVYTSLNGESYFHGEWALVLSRLGIQFDTSEKIFHHASCCGDLGAATGGMQIALALDALNTSHLKLHREALLWAAADSTQRMALTIRNDNLQ